MINIKKISIIALLLLVVGAVGSLLTFKSTDEHASDWVTEEKLIDSDELMNIKIETDNTKLEILPTSDSTTIIELSGKSENHRLSTDVEGSMLFIRVKEKQKWLFNFNFFSMGSLLKVYLPEKQYDSIELESDNGSIKLDSLKAKDITAETENGRIELREVISSALNVEADNGKIILANVEGEIYGKTNNGSISLVTSQMDRPMELKTDNGSINIQTEKEPTNAILDVKVDNGKINIFGNSNWDTVIGNGDNLIKLMTNNGKITVTK